MKTAIVVLADPKGGDEALGRLFNALAVAYELKNKSRPVGIVFQGAGTRWPSELVRVDHPAHGIYEAVRDQVTGISSGCADVFGAETEKSGLELLTDNGIPGTSGVASLARYATEGYTVLTF